MALTPADIHQKEFKTARFGGYNEEEVDLFLDQIADELEKMIQENARVEQEMEHLKKRLSEFEEMQTSLQSALLAATRSAEAIQQQAKQEAAALVAKAREEASLTVKKAKEEAEIQLRTADEQARQMVSQAQAECQKLERTLSRLGEVKGRYIMSIKKIAEEHLAQVDRIVESEGATPEISEAGEEGGEDSFSPSPPLVSGEGKPEPEISPPLSTSPEAATEAVEVEVEEPPEEETAKSDIPQGSLLLPEESAETEAPQAEPEEKSSAPDVHSASEGKEESAGSEGYEEESKDVSSADLIKEVLSFNDEEGNIFLDSTIEDENRERSKKTRRIRRKRDNDFFWE